MRILIEVYFLSRLDSFQCLALLTYIDYNFDQDTQNKVKPRQGD